MNDSVAGAAFSAGTNFVFLVVVGGWVFMAIAVALAAMERKRPFFNWFFVSILFSPFFAVLLLIAAGDGDELRDEQRALLRKIASAAKESGPDTSVDKSEKETQTAGRHDKMKSKPVNFTESDIAKFSGTRDRPVPKS